MRWSVLLPTHDQPDTLGHSIRSVLAQTDGDLELIVVGDGCSDATRAVIASFTDPRILFLDRSKGVGFGYAQRAVALRDARGALIAFASDDDLWAPNHLETLGHALEQGQAMAYSTPLWAVPTGEIVPTTISLTNPLERAVFESRNYLPSTCVVVRREALERAGGWPTDPQDSADWVLWKRIMALPGARVASVPFGTSLHFRARRRDADPLVVTSILRGRGRSSWWPAAATLPVGPGVQQEAAASAAADPEWWARLADATAAIERHLAFDWVLAQDEASDLRHEIERLARALAELDRDYRTSRSWRLTAPMRQLASWLAKRG